MANNPAGRLRLPVELRHPLFLVGTVLYSITVLHKYGGPLSPHWPLPGVVRSHLADFLSLPLELTLVLCAMRRLYFRQPSFVLPASWIFSTWLVFSVWFEVVPLLQSSPVVRNTPDPWDVVAYALGGLVFWRWMNRPALI
ncbi:hypothetical protein [Hymenobacter metallilatus]|uniref:Magnesium citrate secondary transporter n=1 Tax=Hymenobacter metallilatus TaxID=2493666 RepID=A0A428JMK4_9BACT|nr:hypothetical protein [Hymenobacter metallilatus]RSK34511.1 hypothetical protein EI290_07735 [Hymenobacter metallilatus]